ncbi:MAG: 23S rRNA (pseudouridine(1915)-N(3))-methyltransferase RlmH, partial [Fibrobacter sp.]|nr:23S rRNA (pseudouridine(1915)-N(3))-methyltransferase RlmH [Fibrobacter sp.]
EFLDLVVVAIGKMKDPCLRAKVDEYKNSIAHDSRLEIVEIKDLGIAAETEKIKKIIQKANGYVFALGDEGREYDSVSFAKRIQLVKGKIVFVIGGAYGLSDEIKKGANELLSLSKMTFTHEIARVLLFEQLFRSLSIIHNKSYHK